MQDLFDLTGMTALVTGCSRGIGRAMAAALAGAGADIIGVSASLESGGSAVEKEVRARGRRFKAYACDLGDRIPLDRFIKTVKADFPVIDILVNNAGIVRRAPAIEHDDAIWDEVRRVNLDAPFLLAREIGRDMVRRGRGKIVFTASVLTFQGGITVPGYAASKGAVGQLVKALANEWAPHGVNVNAVAPGYIETDNTEALRNDPDRRRAILERIPAGRWGTPEDLAGVTVFLCAPASDYMHGTIVTVDGGWMGR
jgi:2-deoxy-D-gluconate 3-dehydrogenase